MHVQTHTLSVHTDSSKCSRNKVHSHWYGRKKRFRPPQPVYGAGQVRAVRVGGVHLCTGVYGKYEYIRVHVSQL